MVDRDTVLENIKLSKKRWNGNHKEYHKIYGKQYYQNNKERINKNSGEYYRKNKERIREYRIEYNIRTRDNTRRKRIRLYLLQLLGNKCIKCGFSDSRALQFDHINDDGYADRKLLKSADGILCYYYKNPEIAKKKIQILCANCNWIKRFEMKKHNQYNKY